MKTKQKNTNSKMIFGLLATNFLVMSFLVMFQVRAASSNCGLLVEGSDEKEKCEELEKRADVYREIIDIKQKQGETLNDQLAVTDSNIAQLQTKIDDSKEKIDDYNSQISRIEGQMREKEETIAAQKEILAKLVQTYYEVNLANPIVSYLTDGNIASFIVKKDRIAQTGDKIRELVESVKQIRDNLQQQSGEVDKKKGEIVLTHEKLKNQNGSLESVKTQKENLLAQTKGEEIRYQQLLARVESQKQELLDIDQYFAASGLSADSYPKPDSKYFASTSWYFSQRDPKWANENIGNTKTLMKSYGCAVTAVAMVLKQHGGSETPGILANKAIYSGDLINWPSSWSSPKVTLVSSVAHGQGAVNWATVDAQIAKKNPVIVYIGKTRGSGGHYVVIHSKDLKTGKYIVHDPYFGPNIYLDTTRALIGAMGVSSSTKIDQMIVYN